METLQSVFPARDFGLLAAIILLPLLGAIVNGIFGKRLGREAVTLMGLASVGASFVASLVAFFMLRAQREEGGITRFAWTAWQWLSVSRDGEMDAIRETGATDMLELNVGFFLDSLNGTMALVVTGVGFLIHLYSAQYMKEDPSFHRFFAYLNLFIFAMLVLILGDSLPVLFVGWEGVGLCSYLLIGFWFTDLANAAAGKKAFIANRIGDFGLLVAMALLLKYTGSLSWDGVAAGAQGLIRPVTVWEIPLLENSDGILSAIGGPHQVSAATLVGLSLFLGCAGKSAQIPLYVWLPDAMAGPTPVSALIHAATMVTAGVYLVCRMAPVFVMSPAAMLTIATIGALTAVLAASIAFAQNDIKKVLAYSTVSQLGYMFLGVGVGAFTAGFFHVITHAFFKACLFLGAGSVIYAMHARIHDTNASQDVRYMGGLRKYMPVTHVTFAASTAAIVGTPFTSGFYSKDAILLGAFTSSVKVPGEGKMYSSTGPVELFTWPDWAPTVLFALGAIGAVMTAFYMLRIYILAFFGEFKGWKIVAGYKAPHADDHDHHGDHHETPGAEHMEGPTPSESPWPMTVPLMVLGFLALVGGFWNAHPLTHFMDEWLEPVFETASRAVEINTEANGGIVMGCAVAAWFFGCLAAWYVYVKLEGAPAADFAERYPGFYALVYDKWRVDEMYDEFIIGTVDFIADICVWIDEWVVDGIIARFSSWLVAVAGHLLRLLQTGRVQAYAAVMMVGMAGVGWFVTAPHAAVHVDGADAEGQYELSAASGLGYQYRWDLDGDGKADSDDFSSQHAVTVSLSTGEERKIGLEVKNAFGRIASKQLPLSRPNPEAAETGARHVDDAKRLARAAAAEDGR